MGRGGPSYTIDTVLDIVKRYSVESKPGLIIGDDLFIEFDTWKEAERLSGLVDLIVAHRNTTDRVAYTSQKNRFPNKYLENPLLPVSSSDIRERLQSGLSIRFLVPEKVIQYIEANGLYR